MKIGFIGLGNMGGPMAAVLGAAGYAVRGFDPVARPPDGVAAAGSTADAADGADCVVTMLPDGDTLRSVAAELHPTMASGALHVDCSTVDVQSARAVAEAALAHGIAPLDAPVSGGTAGAAAGTLTFMVGGSAEAVDRARPLFDAMGQKAVHCGGPGTGQAAKLCNNMILGATMAVTCEAFVLADALGLDRTALYDVVSTSSGASWSMTSYCPAPGVGPVSPADRNYAPGFATALMLKDLRLAMQAAEAHGADVPIGAKATETYADFAATADAGSRDFSALIAWLAAKPKD